MDSPIHIKKIEFGDRLGSGSNFVCENYENFNSFWRVFIDFDDKNIHSLEKDRDKYRVFQK